MDMFNHSQKKRPFHCKSIWIFTGTFLCINEMYFLLFMKNTLLLIAIKLYFLDMILTRSWWRFLSYESQSSNLQSKSIDWYDKDLHHEIVEHLVNSGMKAEWESFVVRERSYPANIYLFEVSNTNTRKKHS